jgi:hypothetical protein
MNDKPCDGCGEHTVKMKDGYCKTCAPKFSDAEIEEQLSQAEKMADDFGEEG